MLLSIIIPHHNREKELKELLDSIPTVSGVEVIIVDDHSEKVVRTPARACVRILNLPKDQRYAGSARNLGITHATGKWVLFADSDDKFDTQSLIIMLERLQSASDDIIHTPITSFKSGRREGRRHVRINRLLNLAQTDPKVLIKWYPPWAKFFRLEFLRENNICFQKTRVSNDVLFSASALMLAKNIAVDWTPIYRVRESDDSLTTDRSIEAIAERLEVLVEFNSLLKGTEFRRYRTPAFVQVYKIFVRHPVVSIKLLIEAKKKGTPMFFTIGLLINIFRLPCYGLNISASRM